MLFKICKFFQHQPMNCTRLYRGERGSEGKKGRERERQQRERAHARSRATASDRQRANASPPMSSARVFERVRTRMNSRLLNGCVVDLDALTILKKILRTSKHLAPSTPAQACTKRARCFAQRPKRARMALHVARSRSAACSSTVMSQGRTWSVPAARQRTLGTSASHG
jgi:hypothetical protein